MNVIKTFLNFLRLNSPKKTPRVIQMEAVECGAAALSIILGYYERFVSLEELRVMCGVSRDGVSAYNITQAAEHYGLEAVGYEMDVEDLQDILRPAILFWDHNHFVVLERIRGRKVYINDPATGPRRIDREELEQSYSGLVLECQPRKEFQKGGKDLSLLSRLIEKIIPFKEALIYLFFVQLSLVVIGLTAPVFSQIFIDKFLGETIPNWKSEFLLLIAGIMLFTGGITWIRGKFLNALQAKLSIRYSTEFLWHILRLPAVFFSQRSGGEVINRIGLNNRIATIFTGEVVINLISLSLVGVYVIIMFQYNVLLTLIAIFTAFINLSLLWYVNRTRIHAYARLQQEDAKTIGVSLDTLEHIEAIKTAANEAYFFSRIAGYYTRSINAFQSIRAKSNYLSTFSSFSQQLSTVLLLTIGCWEILHGRLTIGMLIAFQILLSSFLRPFNQLVSFGSEMQSVKVDLARVDDVLKNSPDPIVKERSLPEMPEEKLKGKIEFQHVTFGFSPLDEPFIEDFNLVVKAGEIVALVGPVGSGKTTLSRLATSLFQPSKGRVLYDGKDFTRISRTIFRNSLAAVDQQIHLFAGTIKENITLWDKNISDESVANAARNACIEKEILALPSGYQAPLLEEGQNLSQGQRQRIEIARALVLDPSILIMDEATNSLDAETEEELLQNLRERGCTCLIISHRLSTIKRADKILVLDRGKVVQVGTHQDLRKNPGLYKSLLEHEIT